MSNTHNIDFDSKNIKKKDLKFNIQEKKSTTLKAKIKNFWSKVQEFWKTKILGSPLFKGKNKFITLGVSLVVIAAAITLPIVLPKIMSGDPGTSESDPEGDDEEEKQQVKEEVADIVNNIDPDASDEVQDAVLSDLDTKIAASSDPDHRAYLIQAKANALLNLGRTEESLNTLKSLVGDLTDRKDWLRLSEVNLSISIRYETMGDISSAIAAMHDSIAAHKKTADDNEWGIPVSGLQYREDRLRELENLQQQ